MMMYFDSINYLPNDILVKLDRAAMASSLETRLPLLDHRIIEFAWSIPLEMKLRNNSSKWLLKEVLKRYLPDENVSSFLTPQQNSGIYNERQAPQENTNFQNLDSLPIID